MPWLIDTNTWIHYLKNASSPVALRLREHSPSDIVTCAVVKAELLHGAMKYGVPERRIALVREALAPFASLAFDDLAAEHYSQIRHGLEMSGNAIGPYDLLIAAICVSRGCTLVTDNVREFSRVPNLLLENWVNP